MLLRASTLPNHEQGRQITTAGGHKVAHLVSSRPVGDSPVRHASYIIILITAHVQ